MDSVSKNLNKRTTRPATVFHTSETEASSRQVSTTTGRLMGQSRTLLSQMAEYEAAPSLFSRFATSVKDTFSLTTLLAKMPHINFFTSRIALDVNDVEVSYPITSDEADPGRSSFPIFSLSMPILAINAVYHLAQKPDLFNTLKLGIFGGKTLSITGKAFELDPSHAFAGNMVASLSGGTLKIKSIQSRNEKIGKNQAFLNTIKDHKDDVILMKICKSLSQSAENKNFRHQVNKFINIISSAATTLSIAANTSKFIDPDSDSTDLLTGIASSAYKKGIAATASLLPIGLNWGYYLVDEMHKDAIYDLGLSLNKALQLESQVEGYQENPTPESWEALKQTLLTPEAKPLHEAICMRIDKGPPLPLATDDEVLAELIENNDSIITGMIDSMINMDPWGFGMACLFAKAQTEENSEAIALCEALGLDYTKSFEDFQLEALKLVV